LRRLRTFRAFSSPLVSPLKLFHALGGIFTSGVRKRVIHPKPRWRWLVTGKKVTGAAHQHKPCQDWIDWRESQGAVVLAVADGHGSEHSPHSEEGARFGVEVAMRLLLDIPEKLEPGCLSLVKHYAEDQLPRHLVTAWAEEVRKHHSNHKLEGVGSCAETEGESRNEEDVKQRTGWERTKGPDPLLLQYGSTLLAVLATQDFLLLLQLGDGDILIVEEDGKVKRAFPRDARLIANETTSLCSPYAWNDMHVAFEPLVEKAPALILVCTDGYTNSFASEEDFLKVGFDYLQAVRDQGLEYVNSKMEEWLRETSHHGSGDDIAVGIIYRSDECKGSASRDFSQTE
jgi:serine/threonine protein phosphatase PrpC